jgi:flagellar protein FliO/FliZ
MTCFNYCYRMLFLGLFSLATWASESPIIKNMPPRDKVYQGIDSSHFVESILSLILVLGVIFGAAWVLKRFKGVEVGSQKQLKIVESISLGSKEKIAVIRCGEQFMLLGITQNQISHLAELTDYKETAESASPVSFKTLLEKASNKQKQVTEEKNELRNEQEPSSKGAQYD